MAALKPHEATTIRNLRSLRANLLHAASPRYVSKLSDETFRSFTRNLSVRLHQVNNIVASKDTSTAIYHEIIDALHAARRVHKTQPGAEVVSNSLRKAARAVNKWLRLVGTALRTKRGLAKKAATARQATQTRKSRKDARPFRGVANLLSNASSALTRMQRDTSEGRPPLVGELILVNASVNRLERSIRGIIDTGPVAWEKVRHTFPPIIAQVKNVKREVQTGWEESQHHDDRARFHRGTTALRETRKELRLLRRVIAVFLRQYSREYAKLQEE
jgi:hypothetical protein